MDSSFWNTKHVFRNLSDTGLKAQVLSSSALAEFMGFPYKFELELNEYPHTWDLMILFHDPSLVLLSHNEV